MASTVLLECNTQKAHKRSFEMVGKSQKFSRPLSSSFGPHNGNAVEAVGESEGLGSLCRVDSDDSRGPKRKCVSLNTNRGDAFDIPMKVYTYSRMSSVERKELETKLRAELEQVRALEKKLKSRSNANISNGSANDSSVKRGVTGKFQSTKQRTQPPPSSTASDSIAAVMKQCESLLTKLMKHPFGWVFSKPVDAVALNIPDYYTVIKHPMDFGTIMNRISSGGYSSPWGFASDVRLTFTNAMTYNPPGNDVHIMGDKLSKFFEPKWKHIERNIAFADSSIRRDTEVAKPSVQSKKKKPSPADRHSFIQETVKPRVTPNVPIDRHSSIQETVKPKVTPNVPISCHSVKQETIQPRVMPDVPTHSRSVKQEPAMSREFPNVPVNCHSAIQETTKSRVTASERAQLSERLGSIIEDLPDNIIDFLRMHNKVVNEAGEEEIEVDIDALSDDKLLELKSLLDDYIERRQQHSQSRQQQVKSEPTVLEILSEPGMSSSSMHLRKDNEPVADEDVDIGGNDPPITNYPPVDIVKELAPKSSKCSSSSSSSSDSSSSSSDSDSGSSSGSESEDRGASPAKITEGSVKPDRSDSKDIRDAAKPLNVNKSSSMEDKPDQGAHPKHVSVAADAQQEGENAPSERQVSPSKFYREAILKDRFADTILKAREKTLDQVHKDPEKIHRERKELERRQREEKARIQAEAKAARKIAESKARSEAKRKRELEREAARQALLKMEKTVEINENCLVLGDLEMLGTVSGDCGPPSIDDTNIEHSLDRIGSFKLGGSNPLEQLGLFMKDDYEEEEDALAHGTEEGEID